MDKYKRRLYAIITAMMLFMLPGCAAVGQNDVNPSQSPVGVAEATASATDSVTQGKATSAVTKTAVPTKKPTQAPTKAPATQKVTQTPKMEVSQKVSSNLEVYFIDVGQGDCILLKSDGQTMLIDAGDNAYGKGVVDYLKGIGIKRLDYVIGTHPDADHIGGLDNVIQSFDIGKIYMPRKQSNTKTFEDVLMAIQKKGLKISSPKVGDTFTLGSAKVTIFGPTKSYEDSNDNSIVLKVNHGKNSFLFTGDAELEAEEDMVASGEDLSATVLKVGHHGSHSSTSQSLLAKVKPAYAVISCGINNKYGHPHTETMTYLKRANVKVYRTDEQKTILMTSDGDKLAIKTGKPSVTAVKTSYGDSASSSSKNDSSSKESVTSKKDTESTQAPVSAGYIGNKNTKKFHNPDCSYLPKENNQVVFSSRDEAVSAGYEPCQRCNP